MGLFKKIKKAVSHPVSTVKKVVTAAVKNPVRASMAVTSLGLSEAVRQAPLVGTSFKGVQDVAGRGYDVLANVYTSGAYGAAKSTALGVLEPRRDDMGLNLGNLLGGVAAGIGSLAGGGSYSQALSQFSAFLPTPGSGLPQGGTIYPQARPVMATTPMIAGAARAVATVGRSFFNKFPNLATAIQGYRNIGKNVTRAKLYSLLKRFGPELLISGGLLTAAAVNELMIAGPGRRRMNPGNVKALRRSVRRLESFHHLCNKVDKLRRPRSRKSPGKIGSQQFVRQG